MCISLVALFVEFLPYLCVVTVPIYGSFCGVDLILRVSFLLYAYVLCSEFVPGVLHQVVPYLNIGILGLICLYLPVSLIPYPLVWIYDKVLWMSEFGLQVAEIVLALNFVMHVSQRVTEKIEEEQSPVLKFALVCFTSLCYAMMASFGLAIYKEGSLVQLWLLFLVLVLCLAVHNMMWMSQEGILCDAAFSCLCCVAVLYTMKDETNLINHPLNTPETWYRYDKRQSLISIGRYIIGSSIDNAGLALQFLMKFLQPFFLVTLGIRLYSILYITEKVTKNFFDKEDSVDDYFDQEAHLSPWRSPLTMKLAVIFMFTQMTTNLFYASQGISFARFYPLEFLQNFYPSDIVLGRVLQILVVNVFYMWRLYCAEEWEWSDWFSS
ncbi:uncharacterized protein LOC110463107 [Mizuhopecten yessoensis]|uniref:Uncharacterized protein n=1 Tax=Mizuhopecten yessoensis TaxID=6573 RepID=A0A210PWR5_MIZYE|nr:uncharacterized protein LOC110463107 [Mizuhopecten yessoensis]XP_021373131.1 uncharacterized protein LOC110463107 [Mizuhopecten yessoensis]OWF40938.1 hypothetical protein KP79_PYT15966 [Mizuhopecten yessoensis]